MSKPFSGRLALRAALVARSLGLDREDRPGLVVLELDAEGVMAALVEFYDADR
jgi:hypothetical protein